MTFFAICLRGGHSRSLAWRAAAFACFALLFGQCLAVPASAQGTSAPLRFERLGVPQGLSQASVTRLAVDGQGFLWAATLDGLNRYDGYGFKVFRHDPADNRTLSDNTVQALHVDSSGRLWVGTRSGGLNRYNPADETFVRYRRDPADPGAISSNEVLAVHEDRQGRLWVATGKGLGYLTPESGVFKASPSPDSRTRPTP